MDEINNIKKRILEAGKFVATVKPAFPTNMLIELTNACNHRCIFCTSHKMTRKIGHINEDLLDRLLRESFSLGTTDVGFHTTGEPFISRGLAQYIAKAKNIGFKYVYLSTNGSLATPERLKSVIDAGLDSIKFSINAGTPQTYKMVHGRDEFRKVLNNLKFASEYRNKMGKSLKIYVTYVVTKQNKDECGTLKNLIGSLADAILFSDVGNQSGTMFEVNQYLKVEKENLPVNQPPCSMLFNRFHITHEGYLTICCVDFQNYLIVADLNTCSLKDAWHNERFVEIRRRHLEDKLEGTLCYNCLYNKNTRVEPLMQQYATVYDGSTFTDIR